MQDNGVYIVTQENSQLSYSQLIDELKQYCSNKRTGTMYIVTDDSQSARFVIKNGEIVSIAIRTVQGSVAIEHIKRINKGKSCFMENLISKTDEKQDLPSTDQLLDLLSVDGATPFSDPSALPLSSFSKVRQIIENEATNHLGPMASIICAEYFEGIKDQHDINALRLIVKKIAAEIGDVAKEKEFQ